ncbi:pantoate--beta-alanine ligase [Stappia sp. TSB10GB4]|uniref:pantoate--beta-alanine ligase n=1 Tax=Stappia sp. TSB10GB4 TaxID=2003584 RepID=UPI0016455D6B|nr:pantoate--beta-alanine ligase [Stappia sp. TSB10GB4]
MTRPKVHETVADLRQGIASARAAGRRIALVPTMGALHEGHLSLVRAARARAEHVVVSIFVNPTQFAPTEDFDAYPRDNEADIRMLADLSVEGVFLPSVAEMYPQGFATGVTVGGPSQGLESVTRPHFFNGVAIVVTKLLLAALPDVAVFGEKDYQQLAVVRRFVTDLGIPTEILGAPTVREADGLAMSSRNRYLDAGARRTAALIPQVLTQAIARIEAGEPAAPVLAEGTAQLAKSGFAVDYLDLRDAATLAPVGPQSDSARLLVAARLGSTRLIDNMAVARPASGWA